MTSTTDMKKYTPLIPVAALVLVAVSFLAGMQTQKAMTKSSTPAAGPITAGGSGGFAARGGRSGMRPTFGTVSSVNGTSLVVKTSGDATVTVTLSDSTQITDDSGATAPASSIKVGDTIAVFGKVSSDGSTVAATRIRLNPASGGGGGGQQPQPDSSGAVTN